MDSAKGASKGKAQVSHVFIHPTGLVARQVHAHQCVGNKLMRGFFECLSRSCRHQGLAGVEMAGGLVEFDALRSQLFDQQKALITLDDGGDGNRGFPN